MSVMQTPPVTQVADGVFRVEDTCAVYVVRSPSPIYGERRAVAIDFGSGLVLDHLKALGVDRISDVVMTHHHRDQGQGLHRAVAAGAAIHVPPVEADLFARVEQMWVGRAVDADYTLRDDRFSLLHSVPVAGLVPEYRTGTYAGVPLRVLPTPGHTTGSVSYLLERAGKRLAFTGDLIHSPGKVWSLASTQWSYTDNEGPAMTVLSAQLLRREGIDLLLPSHGTVMDGPEAALSLLQERMQAYVDSRRASPWDLIGRLDDPFVPLTPHLLHNRSANAASYVLLSDTGGALLFDFGYDQSTGWPPGSDRAARRPWLASLPALRQRHGVQRIEVVVPTHYHDDHVAGMPLLRDVEGTQIWSPAHVSAVLAAPRRYDLPCLWHDPIVSDRDLELGTSFTWHEHEVTVDDFPGHTAYAAAFSFAVDGVGVMVTGDQHGTLGPPGSTRQVANYQYRNGFALGDYPRGAALTREVGPGLVVSGHWPPLWVNDGDGYLEELDSVADVVERVHTDLLPLHEVDLGAGGVMARIEPYRSTVTVGGQVELTVHLRQPLPSGGVVRVRPVVDDGWTVEPSEDAIDLPPLGLGQLSFTVRPAKTPGCRQRVAMDITAGQVLLGQHVEALVDVVGAEPVAGDGG